MARVAGTSIHGLLLLTAVAGCSESGPDVVQGETFTVRDSAGIVIVENYAPIRETAAWSVASEPRLQIGAVDGPASSMLNRVADVLRLRDGRIALLNGGTSELRFYSTDGVFISAVGRQGEGPGEFQAAYRLQQIEEDSIQVFDLALGRLSVFDREGALGRTTTLTWPDARGGVIYVGALPDGSHLGYYSVNLMYEQEMDRSGLYREESTFVRYSPGGTSSETVGRFPGMETFALVGDGVPQQVPAPFGKRRLTVLGADGFQIAFTERFEILRYSVDGELNRVIRRRHTPVPVSPEDRASYLEERVPSAWSRLREAITFPETHEVIAQVVVDDLGSLWVRPNDPSGEPASVSAWSIFDSEGRWVTDVDVPSDLEIRHISEDLILGLSRDDLGVEYVHGYALER